MRTRSKFHYRNQLIAMILFLLIGNGYSQTAFKHNNAYLLKAPLELLTWGPSSKEPLNYHSYLENTKIDHLSTLEVAPAIETYMTAYLSGFVFGREIELSKILEISARNYSNPKTKRKKHPLIIYAPGYRGLPFENSLLCEMLAEEGYVVAAIPALGVKHKTDSLGLEIQVDYLQKAIDYLITQEYVDKKNVSLIGFSWGGLSSIMAAMRNKSIKSVISLDGSIRFFYSLAEKMPGFKPSDFNRPVLLFGAEGNDEVDFKFFDKLKPPAYLIKMKGFNHLDFMSYRFLETPYKDSIKSSDYFKMLQTIKHFLNANGTLSDSTHLKSELYPNVVYSKP
jgi:hypothetical protein